MAKVTDIDAVEDQLGVLRTLNLMIAEPGKVSLRHIDGRGVKPGDDAKTVEFAKSLREETYKELERLGVEVEHEK